MASSLQVPNNIVGTLFLKEEFFEISVNGIPSRGDDTPLLPSTCIQCRVVPMSFEAWHNPVKSLENEPPRRIRLEVARVFSPESAVKWRLIMAAVSPAMRLEQLPVERSEFGTASS